MMIRKTVIALLLIVCLATTDVAVFALDEAGTEHGEEIVVQKDGGVEIDEGEVEGTEETTTPEENSYVMRVDTTNNQSEKISPSYGVTKTTNETTTATQPSTTVIKKLPNVKRFAYSAWDTTFKKKVNRNKYLPSTTVPTYFRLKAYRKSIKLTWKKPKSIGSIDGYIVLRKTGKSKRYYEYTRLSKKKTSFIDKKAKKKNTKYAYMVVGYKKGSMIRISPWATPWVVGYTTKSKKKNLYKTKITNAKAISKIEVGSTVKAYAKVPKNTAHKYLRWYSSNPSIATIDDRGTLTAIAQGGVTITVMTATGRTTSTRVVVVEPAPKQTMLEIMRSWVGIKAKNNGHKKIIDIYNSYKPHPRGYKMRYSDAWCDATISAAAIASGNVSAVGLECGVPCHISIFKKKKIWIEDGTITPKPGDIIVFAWSKSKQPNNASGSHIGIVESVKKGKITTIEGNCSNMVKRRTINVGWGYIRGYARPNYVK